MGIKSGSLIINGEDYIWEPGLLLLATGVLDSSYTTYMSTSDFIEIDHKVLTYIGETHDSNDIPYVVYVCEYNSSGTYITRETLVNLGVPSPIRLKYNCAKIKISFGRSSTTGVTATTDDTDLMQIEPSAYPVRLPAEYQEVEWVGTNGSQTTANAIIDTGAVCTTKPRIVTDVYYRSASNIGGYFAANSGITIACYITGSKMRFTYGGASTSTASWTKDPTAFTTWYAIDHSQTLKIDVSTAKSFPAVDWSANTTPIKLFYKSTGGNANTLFREFLIYDDTTLVRDLVPCYRKSDSRCGFYDLVGEQFYTNAGGASVLTKGANV